MSNSSLVAQLLAKNPRNQARFPDVPVDQALREWEELQKKIPAVPSGSAPAQPAPAGADLPTALTGSIANIVTNLWRAKSKMVDAKTGEPTEEMRRIHRHVEGALEAFTVLGLRISDMVNQPYDAGLPVKVLTFQPTAGLTRDTILEVVRPTVIWQDTLLQMGEIVVGIPLQSPKNNA